MPPSAALDTVSDGVLEQRLQQQARHDRLRRQLAHRQRTCRRAPSRSCSMRW